MDQPGTGINLSQKVSAQTNCYIFPLFFTMKIQNFAINNPKLYHENPKFNPIFYFLYLLWDSLI